MDLILAKFLPFIFAYAADTNSTMVTIVKWVGGIGGGIVAIFLIVGLVKDGIALGKGSGDASIFKILTKVLFLVIVLGLIGLAINYGNLTDMGENIGNKASGIVSNEVNGMGL